MLLSILVGVARSQCLVDGGEVEFSPYDPSSPAPLDGYGEIVLWCEDRIPVRIALSPGASGRFLEGPGRLPFQLYRDPDRTRPWGDGGDGEAVDLITDGLRRRLPVYGRIPPGHQVPPGVYGTVVTVLVVW